MTTVFEFWLLVASASMLGAVGLLGGGLRLYFGHRYTGWDMLLTMSIPLALIMGAFAGNVADDPGLYTQTVGHIVPVTVSRLTFLTGVLGRTTSVRVDTDRGVYFLSAEAPVPESGTVYRVQRRKSWNSDTRTFLCSTLAARHCWPAAVQAD
jgi:hypothetical protein